MFWQKPAINLDQGVAYLKPTAGVVLVSLSLGGICLGLGIMKISLLVSTKDSQQRQKEFLKQWSKDKGQAKEIDSRLTNHCILVATDPLIPRSASVSG
jgi:hypothetical protein